MGQAKYFKGSQKYPKLTKFPIHIADHLNNTQTVHTYREFSLFLMRVTQLYRICLSDKVIDQLLVELRN